MMSLLKGFVDSDSDLGEVYPLQRITPLDFGPSIAFSEANGHPRRLIPVFGSPKKEPGTKIAKEKTTIVNRGDDQDVDGDRGLSPAMVARLERASAEENTAGLDALVDNPSVDLGMYQRVVRRRMADHALSHQRVYLDMNYWIWLRQAAFRQSEQPVHTKLWRRLRDLTRTGQVLCPISYPVYSEVMKQNHASRLRTACVVDRLCQSICIVDQSSRIRAQLSHFVWTGLLGDRTLPPADRFVWAPVSHVVGMPVPHHPNLPAELNLMLQKKWLRSSQFWRFSDLLEQMKGVQPEPQDWRSTLYQNFMSDSTRDRLRSLSETYKIEVGNMTDLIAEEITDFATDLFDKGFRSPLGPEVSPADLNASLASIITTGLKMGRINTQFPQYHIMGVIHATIRWMRRRHQVNDRDDHQHATAALPYCDAFFTERGMRDTLTRGPFHVDEAYQCRVISDPKEALTYLEDTAGGANPRGT